MNVSSRHVTLLGVALLMLGGCGHSDSQDASSANSALSSQSCLAEVGAQSAAQFAQECQFVTRGANPLCIADENRCDVILDQIKQGCDFDGPEKAPDFCQEFADEPR